MPIYRDPDGKVVEEKTERIDPKDAKAQTRKVEKSEKTRGAGTEGTERTETTTGSGVSEAGDFYTDRTRKIGGRGTANRGTEATRLIGGRKRGTEERTVADEAVDDPGGRLARGRGRPGQGNRAELGYGTNSIGRSQGERVPLPFGDTRISRNGHAVVTYDPRGRKYYVQHGGGRNLTYLNGQPVLSPTALPDRSRIVIGGTTLCFAAFCGAAFDWQDGGDEV